MLERIGELMGGGVKSTLTLTVRVFVSVYWGGGRVNNVTKADTGHKDTKQKSIGDTFSEVK